MCKRNVVYTILYSVIVFLSFLPLINGTADASSYPSWFVAYNALLLAIVALLALDVVTIGWLMSSGTVVAANAAIASNAATVVLYIVKTGWTVVTDLQPAHSAYVGQDGLTWLPWVYFGVAAIILTAKTISVLVLFKVRSKLTRGELNLTGMLMADPLLDGGAATVVGVPVAGA